MLLLHPPPFSAIYIQFGCQSLTTVQLRDSWGQPTMRVYLHCFKGSHQGMLLNNYYIYAKDLRLDSYKRHRPQGLHQRRELPSQYRFFNVL